MTFPSRSAKTAAAAASLAVAGAAVLASLPTLAGPASAATAAVTTSPTPTPTTSATPTATPTPTPTTPSVPVVPVGLNALADTSIGSAVAPNGDTHPYSVAVVPAGYLGTPLAPGDVLVGDLANSAGVKGRGTTILRFHAGTSSVFSTAVTGPVAQVFNTNGSALWVAGYGAADTGTDGRIVVLHTQTGTTVPVTTTVSASPTPTPTVTAAPVATVSGDPFTGGTISAGRGPWGIEFNHSTTAPAYFWSNADGTIVRDDKLTQPFDTPTATANVQTTLATIDHGASPSIAGGTVVAPQGMVYDAVSDTLYLTDPVNSQIVALKGAATATGAITPTVVLKGGPLHSPRGLAVDPLTGDLLVANGAVDNKLVDVTKAGAVVATRSLDAGAAGAIAGLATTTDTAGQTTVYYVNDNTNTLHSLTASSDAVTLAGAPSLTPTYGTNVSISGRAPAGSTVGIFFHRANVPGYVQRRTLVADANGVFATSFAPNDDYRYYAQVGTKVSASVLVQTTPSVVGTTTRLAAKGHTIVLVGHGTPHSSVLLHFHKAGTASTDYSLLRSVHVDANGIWTKAVVVSVDYRVYGSRGVLHPYTPRYLLKGV